MGVLTIPAGSRVAEIFQGKCRIRSTKLASDLAAPGVVAGQALTTRVADGRSILASANTTGADQFRGIVLDTAFPGQGGVNLLEEGFVVGYDLSSVPYDALIYLGDTPGTISTVASTTKTVPIGRCVCVTDDGDKALYVRAEMLKNW